MREYSLSLREENTISKVICNCCGKEIPLAETDYFHAEKNWGYFSTQDGRNDAFDLCESCYERLIQSFQIQPF